MTVIVSKGLGICNGCIKLQETDRTLALQASDSQDRIDTVVLRLNDNDNVRTCDFYIINGLPSNSPVRPELTRNESVWEIGLADLFISANSTTISSTRITDTRLDSERCGVMSSISEFDTTGLYEQIQSDMAEFKNVEQQEFLEWFETIVGILDEEVAGHLQLEIGMLANLTTSDKTDLVHAINEVNAKVGDTDELPDPTKNVVENVTALNTNLVNVIAKVDALIEICQETVTTDQWGWLVLSNIEDYYAIPLNINLQNCFLANGSEFQNTYWLRLFEFTTNLAFKARTTVTVTYIRIPRTSN